MSEQDNTSVLVPLTWRLAPQVAARAATAWPLCLLPVALLIRWTDGSEPGWPDVSLMAALPAIAWAWMATAISDCARDGSGFRENLLRWARALYVGPLIGVFWCVEKLPAALDWAFAMTFKVALWIVAVGLVIALMIVAASLAYTGIAKLPLSVAVVLGALIIAGAVASSRRRDD